MNGPSDIYVSGSAYKIAKDRAYHHGTMLISSQLSTLGDVLHVSKVCFACHSRLVYCICRTDVGLLLGIYDNPRRNVGSLTSKEFAGVQSSRDSRQIPASCGSGLPRGIPHRGARTLIISTVLLLIITISPMAQAQYVQVEDATNIPYIQDSIAKFPVGPIAFAL
jgi:hypothetical protein